MVVTIPLQKLKKERVKYFEDYKTADGIVDTYHYVNFIKEQVMYFILKRLTFASAELQMS